MQRLATAVSRSRAVRHPLAWSTSNQAGLRALQMQRAACDVPGAAARTASMHTRVLAAVDTQRYALSVPRQAMFVTRPSPFSYVPSAGDQPPHRWLHATPAAPSTVLLVGGLSVAAVAIVARYAVQAWEKNNAIAAPPTDASSAGAPAAPPGDAAGAQEAKEASAEEGGAAASGAAAGGAATSGAAGASSTAVSESWFSKMFGGASMARRFYRGGFEDRMTRREAALILGVRESATPERIRERHRKLLMLNHPDVGGSTFVAGKINEAKDLLLKGGSGRSDR